MRELAAAALPELGIRRLVLAIHGASFPCDPEEDLGAGSPGSQASRRLLDHARGLGFTVVQVGPAGETSRDNPSPYDGAVFSRALASIPKRAFSRTGAFEGLVEERFLDALQGDGGTRSHHRRAHDSAQQLIGEAWTTFDRLRDPDLTRQLQTFQAANAGWIERYALFEILGAGADPIDATLWLDEAPARRERREELIRNHAPAITRYAFGQMIAHAGHESMREYANGLGLAVYGDLQVGLSPVDRWSHCGAFLPGYSMGAPPSRTNREGQPWNYPVLDPSRLQPGGAPFELARARVDKAFAEYDGVRIDHPHGWVCPWVYRTSGDPAIAVREGARLFESPDLPDHPDLATFAIPSQSQLDRTVPRHADGWVRELTPAHVERYSVLFDEIVASARRHGRTKEDITCEVLSTLPRPLQRVLERHRLGRWRVFQKANLEDPSDVYRPENAVADDWAMLGNHDTPSMWEVIRTWDAGTRAKWSSYVVARLALEPRSASTIASDPGTLAAALFAVLLASRAESVMVFFGDLFGFEERFNVPGLVAEENWSLRLPASFAQLYQERLARHAALDLPLAFALALRARGASPSLIARLERLAAGSLPPAAGAGG